MHALYRSLLVTALCVAVSGFMFAGTGSANGGSPVSKLKVHVKAELEPFDTSPEPDAEGTMRHVKEVRKGVIKVDKFKGTVKIPIPASALGIVDEASAENADIRLILSHAGTDFAECRLVFDEIEGEDDDDDDDELQAKFKVHVRIKKGTPQAKKGVCDIDLLTPDIQSGVPDARVDDVATVTLVTGGTPTDFLEGTFERH